MPVGAAFRGPSSAGSGLGRDLAQNYRSERYTLLHRGPAQREPRDSAAVDQRLDLPDEPFDGLGVVRRGVFGDDRFEAQLDVRREAAVRPALLPGRQNWQNQNQLLACRAA